MPSQPSAQPQPEIPESTLTLEFLDPYSMNPVGRALLTYSEDGQRVQLMPLGEIPAGSIAVLPLASPGKAQPPPTPSSPDQPKFSSFDHH